MKHRFGERFPKLNDLIVIPWFNRKTSEMTVQYEMLVRLYGQRIATAELMNQISSFYEEAAENWDFLLYNEDGEEVQDLEDAVIMDMNTGLLTPDGHSIWVRSGVNQREGSYFFGKDVFMQPAVGESVHRLLQQYFSAQTLIWYAPLYVQQNLAALGVNVISNSAAIALIEDSWRRLTDDQLKTELAGMDDCDLEDAERIVFPLCCRTTDGQQVEMVCVSNAPRTPAWIGKIRVRPPRNAHGQLQHYPNLFGRDNNAMIFAPAAAIQRMNGRLIELARIADPVHHCEQELQVHYREGSERNFHYFDAHRNPCSEAQAKYMHFRTGMYKADTNDEIILVVSRNEYSNRQPWSMGSPNGWTVTTVSDPYPGVKQRDYIFQFADFGSGDGWHLPDAYRAMLETIRNRAVEEPWHFRDDGSLSILDNYIRYTFARQYKRSDRFVQDSKSIVYNQLRTMAAINIGLSDKKTNREIYLVFHRNQPDANVLWRFENCCTCVDALYTKNFPLNALPALPTYWKDITELVYAFNYERPVEQQLPSFHLNHLMARLHRFPKEFFRMILGFAAPDEQMQILEILDHPEFREAEGSALRQILEGNQNLLNQVDTQIRRAIQNALERQRVNYKYIIPTFYPETGKMCFLMPLNLTNSGRPDLAMVLSRGDDGYFGVTVLTMDMAYADSRLICKPETDWLKPENICRSSSLEEDG